VDVTMGLFFIIDRQTRRPGGPHRWMVHLIANNAGANGHTVRSVNALTGDRIARSTGSGYNLHGDVLANTVDKLIGREWGIAPIDGAAGVPAVVEHYAARGVDIISDTDAMWRL